MNQAVPESFASWWMANPSWWRRACTRRWTSSPFEQLGDPLPGRAKKLQLTYTLDGETRQAEVAEGSPLALQTASLKHRFRLTSDPVGRLEFVCGFSMEADGGPIGRKLALGRDWSDGRGFLERAVPHGDGLVASLWGGEEARVIMV